MWACAKHLFSGLSSIRPYFSSSSFCNDSYLYPGDATHARVSQHRHLSYTFRAQWSSPGVESVVHSVVIWLIAAQAA